MYLFDDSFVLLDKKIEEDSNFFDMNIGEDINSSNLINLNLEKIKECIIDCLENQKLVKLELVSFINEEEEIFDIRLAPVNEFQALILIRNITARIYQQRKLQKSQEKEREALDAKQRYLSFMTHEIRTPLNAIVGLTDLIFDTNPTPKQMEYLKSIRSSSSILSKIINDVLDFNKLENNKIRLDEIVFNIQTVFKDVIRTCTVYSYNKPLTLSYDIDKRIPSILKGDAFKLTQVLTNLISNAIKFTPKGRVTANANLLQLEDNQVIIKFEVKDTGIGIPKDKQDRVFNSYEQLESSISRKFGGTGLGLTISQKFVELMGGKIELESELNQGSIFTFIIPFELSKEELKKEAQLARVDFSPYHILLVEDNDMNQLVMGKYFNKWGISYDIAENGEEALKLIEEVEYNLILLDLEMPIMDGFETAIHIRGHENADISSTPILALSASVFSEVEEHTKAIGFNGFIGKPINANYIYKKISEYLIKDLIVEDVESTPVANVHALDIHFTSFDLSYLLETSLNDAKYIRKMVDLFVSKTPDYIKELYHLYEEENYLELRKLAHKFKASVAIMGVQRAEIAIHNLETNISNNIKYDQIPSQLKIIKESSLLACKELKELLETNRFF